MNFIFTLYSATSIQKTLLLILCLYLAPTISFAKAVPAKSHPVKEIKKRFKQKTVHQSPYLSVKKPRYYHKKPLDLSKKHPNQLACEGPDMAQTLGILALLLLIWAVPTGILVLLGLIFGITWLWILGLVLFLIPVVFLAIVLLAIVFN